MAWIVNSIRNESMRSSYRRCEKVFRTKSKGPFGSTVAVTQGLVTIKAFFYQHATATCILYLDEQKFRCFRHIFSTLFEPRHDKINKMRVRPAKTQISLGIRSQISLGIRPVWSKSSLSAWRSIRTLATHWTHSEDSDQIGRMPRLVWVFARRTLILLVLSCRGSYLVTS